MSELYAPAHEFSFRLTFTTPKFTWRWLFPSYREGYSDGVAAGKAAERVVLRTPIVLPEHDGPVMRDDSYVAEFDRLPVA
jgi:hypothetical protein